MKKLSLLIFAILILACGTEKPVVEEPEPVIEEPPPVVMELQAINHPLGAKGTVKHRQVNVDPEPLNRSGFRYEFTQDFLSYRVGLYHENGERLPSWDSFDSGSNFVLIRHMDPHDLLEYDTKYILIITAQDLYCDYTKILIQFRTKPQRPVVGRPQPVIQERPPAVPLGERFRVQPPMPEIEFGNVFDGEINVHPRPLNANGIEFFFNVPIRKYKIDLRIKDGASLGWSPPGLG